MNGWITFWGALLLVTLICYSVLVVYVAVGGFKDIKQMFASLSKDGDGDDQGGEDER